MYNGFELQLAMNLSSIVGDRNVFLPEWEEYLELFKPVVGRTRGSKPVLTTCRYGFYSYIAQPIKGDAGRIEDWVVTLIEWERLGWLPAFSQAVLFKTHLAETEDIKLHFQTLAEAVCEDDYTEVIDF